MTRGIFREGDKAHSTRDGQAIFPIARRIYELNGYQPAFEDLPSMSDYLQQQGRIAA